MGISGEGVIVDESLSLVETLCLFVRAGSREHLVSVILRYYFQLSLCRAATHAEALLLVTMRTCMYDVCDVCVGSSERGQRSCFVLQ